MGSGASSQNVVQARRTTAAIDLFLSDAPKAPRKISERPPECIPRVLELQISKSMKKAIERAANAKEQASGKRCPRGHALEDYVRDKPGSNNCDGGCGRKGIVPPEHIFRCHQCDFDCCKKCYKQAFNDEGAAVRLGTKKDGDTKYYCGRRLGVKAIPGSDGSCGPNDGPQCESCKRYQQKENKAIGDERSGAEMPEDKREALNELLKLLKRCADWPEDADIKYLLEEVKPKDNRPDNLNLNGYHRRDNQKLGDKEAAVVAEALLYLPQVTAVNLVYNKITIRGARDLGAAIMENKKFGHLKLSRNPVSTDANAIREMLWVYEEHPNGARVSLDVR